MSRRVPCTWCLTTTPYVHAPSSWYTLHHIDPSLLFSSTTPRLRPGRRSKRRSTRGSRSPPWASTHPTRPATPGAWSSRSWAGTRTRSSPWTKRAGPSSTIGVSLEKTLNWMACYDRLGINCLVPKYLLCVSIDQGKPSYIGTSVKTTAFQQAQSYQIFTSPAQTEELHLNL